MLFCIAMFFLFNILKMELKPVLSKSDYRILYLVDFYFGLLRDWYICLFFSCMLARDKFKILKLIIYTGYVIITTLMIADYLLLVQFPNDEGRELAYQIWHSAAGLIGAMIYIIFGAWMFLKVYISTKEKKPLFLCIGCILGGMSWIIHFLKYALMNSIPFISNPLTTQLESAFALLGIGIVSSVYLLDLDYVYRLPDEYYAFLIKHRDGIALYKADIENKQKIVIQEDLIAGFLSAVNTMFVETLNSKFHIDEIASGDATIIMRSKPSFTAIIIGNKSPRILEIGLKNFTEEFEEEFKDILAKGVMDISVFERTKDILKHHFPFLHIVNRSSD
jgi:hypothetical protein